MNRMPQDQRLAEEAYELIEDVQSDSEDWQPDDQGGNEDEQGRELLLWDVERQVCEDGARHDGRWNCSWVVTVGGSRERVKLGEAASSCIEPFPLDLRPSTHKQRSHSLESYHFMRIHVIIPPELNSPYAPADPDGESPLFARFGGETVLLELQGELEAEGDTSGQLIGTLGMEGVSRSHV